MGLTASDHASNPKIPKCHRSDPTLPSELSKRVLDILYSREYRSRFPSFILGARKEKGKRRKVKGNQRQNAKVRGMHTHAYVSIPGERIMPCRCTISSLATAHGLSPIELFDPNRMACDMII